jgi:hypothetical protein
MLVVTLNMNTLLSDSVSAMAGGDDRRCLLCRLWPTQTEFNTRSTECVDGAEDD